MADKDLKQAGTLGGGKWERLHDISRRVYDEEGVSPTIPTTGGDTEVKILQRPRGKNKGGIIEAAVCPTITGSAFEQNTFMVGAIRGRNPDDPSDRTAGAPTKQMLEIKDDGESTNTITGVQKDNVVIEEADGVYTRASKAFYRGPLADKSRAIRAGCDDAGAMVSVKPTPEWLNKYVVEIDGRRCVVRKLTPLECWRLFGYYDKQFYAAKTALEQTYYKGKDKASSQLYKQAGNTIVVTVLEAIFASIKGIEKFW